MNIRPRRNRKSEVIRGMIRETQVSLSSLIYPMFIIEGDNLEVPITSMPGISRFTLDRLLVEIGQCVEVGLNSFVLFPAVSDHRKDKVASYGLDPSNFYLLAARAIKSRYPDVCLISDVAMDPYSSDGHDGFVQDGEIINDLTLPILAKMAVLQAQAGFDIIGPSDMMDGRVEAIRNALDEAGFYSTSIMSYTAKYASAFYGPFRDALDSAPKLGDKKTYQMDPANAREALREADLDAQEGADFLMVKPALCYLDIIHSLKQNSLLPIAAYNVSGEYAMLMAAAEKGWINLEKAMPEMLLSMRRAGADVILTYFAKQYAILVQKEKAVS